MADPCRIRSEELLNKKTTAHGLSAIPQDRKKSYILCLKTDVPAGQNTSREEGERSPERQQTSDSIPTNARLHCKQCLPAHRLTPVCDITKHLLPHGTYSSDYKILTFYKTEAVTFGTDSIPKTEENRPLRQTFPYGGSKKYEQYPADRTCTAPAVSRHKRYRKQKVSRINCEQGNQTAAQTMILIRIVLCLSVNF